MLHAVQEQFLRRDWVYVPVCVWWMKMVMLYIKQVRSKMGQTIFACLRGHSKRMFRSRIEQLGYANISREVNELKGSK